jgi:hypothetical protein
LPKWRCFDAATQEKRAHRETIDQAKLVSLAAAAPDKTRQGHRLLLMGHRDSHRRDTEVFRKAGMDLPRTRQHSDAYPFDSHLVHLLCRRLDASDNGPRSRVHTHQGRNRVHFDSLVEYLPYRCHYRCRHRHQSVAAAAPVVAFAAAAFAAVVAFAFAAVAAFVVAAFAAVVAVAFAAVVVVAFAAVVGAFAGAAG